MDKENYVGYISHALREFEALGWIKDGEWCDEQQESVCNDVLRLLDTLGEQGHSGTTITYTLDMFMELATFKPLSPLTGEDWEWIEICDERTNGVSVFQNKRCSHVFKQSDRFDGRPYDIDAVIFWEWYTDPDTGEKHKCYFNTPPDSFRPIEFPYTPKTEYVYRERPDE